MNYVVNLDNFYGPLDLLLYLIEKNQMDIYDIPIASITDQYMHFIQSDEQTDLDYLGAFLIMASYLLNLKSRMLLPTLQATDAENEEENDPRQELIHQLLEYRRFKQVAQHLQGLIQEDLYQVYFRSGESAEIESTDQYSASVRSLTQAFYNVVESVSMGEVYCIPLENVNVGEKMTEILSRLQFCEKGMIFQDLFVTAETRREVLAMFLALLELIRLQKVEAVQTERFGPIQLCLRVALMDVNEK
ncbi:MAG: segregation/condensation protein A [Bacillota bacterium]|nr:segregation/condensation protein A [Bacillota bacterium]